jgi:hypothetical protein
VQWSARLGPSRPDGRWRRTHRRISQPVAALRSGLFRWVSLLRLAQPKDQADPSISSPFGPVAEEDRLLNPVMDARLVVMECLLLHRPAHQPLSPSGLGSVCQSPGPCFRLSLSTDSRSVGLPRLAACLPIFPRAPELELQLDDPRIAKRRRDRIPLPVPTFRSRGSRVPQSLHSKPQEAHGLLPPLSPLAFPGP